MIAEARADWIYDMTDAYDGDEFIDTGPCHVTENGNAIMAKRISDVVSPILERRAKKDADASATDPGLTRP